MASHYPLRFAAQLRQHLRALRKRRGLTQAQLGARVGVSQARIAEIEAKPGSVNFDQLMQLFSALGITLFIHEEDLAPAAFSPIKTPKGLEPNNKKPIARWTERPTERGQTGASGSDYRMRSQPEIWSTVNSSLPVGSTVSAQQSTLGSGAETVPRQRFVVGAKKGAW